jgi:HIRAN domain
MNRSSFLKQLFTSAIVGKLPVSITKDFRKIYLLQCFIAGFRHYEGMQLLQIMKEGDLLELVREPQNEYDECAIALHYQNKKIGFIPAETNEMLSYLLDAEALSMFAVITHLEKNAQPWENVAVAIYFVQEVNKDLPTHASYLTRIEAPHYRTLNKKNDKKSEKHEAVITFDDLFDTTDRVIDLDKIPTHHQEAKKELEKYFSEYPVEMKEKGNYVHVKNDGIYSFLYDIKQEIIIKVNKEGKEFLEFFLE